MIGKTVSHYRLLEKLGAGAMGIIYKAEDLKLDRLVAIKFLPQSLAFDSEHKSRFIREAKAASALEHVNICTIYEFGETEDGELFICMAYCQGDSLRERLKRGPLLLGEAIRIAAQIAEGMAKAHAMGVLHRDIKPANVMLTSDGVVKIVDFGLARIPHEIGLTSTGAILGTVAYMSPEQLKAEPLDYYSDVWSWGVTTYEMLAGRLPFRGESEPVVIEAILKNAPPELNQLRPEVPFEFEQIVSQALSKNPRERQRNAEELAGALRLIKPPSDLRIVSAPGISSRASVAVLPLANLSMEPDSEYFSDGLTEELIHVLSGFPELLVVSRTSAFEFKTKPQNIRKIGEQLRVSTIVEGSVRRLGQKLRVGIRLVNVNDGYCLWSQRFDREMKDVFEIQDEIARSIADTLKIELGRDIDEDLIRRRTLNLEAYDLYLRGRFQWNKRAGEGFGRALEYFEKALAHDPNYAPAYSGIADHHITAASWGLEPPAEAWAKAKVAVEKALALDDGLAEAHASMGTVRMWHEWNWSEAEREFRRAVDLNPGHPNAHVQYNLLLVQNGRFDEAEREIRTALSSDPLSIRINSYLAGVFHYRRQYDRSLQQCLRALELDPNDVELHVVQGLNYEQKGDYGEAILELEKARELSGNNPLILGPLGSCYAASGMKVRAMQLIDELDQASRQAYVAPITWAMIYLFLQQKDLAFKWLQKAAEMRDVLLCYLGVGPIYDCIRGDPRCATLLRQLGLRLNPQSQTLPTRRGAQ
jgi:serine/threonine protein kinase/tetratricopeptide (TPR) repeat protein